MLFLGRLANAAALPAQALEHLPHVGGRRGRARRV